jgi:hypothetical protein
MMSVAGQVDITNRDRTAWMIYTQFGIPLNGNNGYSYLPRAVAMRFACMIRDLREYNLGQ